MRLFHVSEEPDIALFLPRTPTRKDLDPSIKLVWAIEEKYLPNFLTPRDCPRVAYHPNGATTSEDRERFFSSPGSQYVVAIESRWFERMRNTRLYCYEFDPQGFALQDQAAGYYVSTLPQTPVAKEPIDDLCSALFQRGVELRVTDNLWALADRVKESSLNWSLCRMGNAQPGKRA